MTPEIQNELQIIRTALETSDQTVWVQNARRALHLVWQKIEQLEKNQAVPE